MARPKRVSDEDIVDILESHGEGPVMSTREVAERLPISQRATLERLDALHEQGEVGKKKVGSRAVVWWFPMQGRWVTSSEMGPQPTEATVEFEFVEPDPDAVDKALTDADLSGSSEKLEQRKEAIKACLQYLIEHETAKAEDFKRDVFPEYEVEYAKAQSWWKNSAYHGLVALAEADLGVVKPDRSGKWKYAPP